MDNSTSPAWGKEQFEVLGGRFLPGRWEAFLQAWQWPDEKRWGTWEFVSDFWINSGELPPIDKLSVLERVDLFGKSGHLSARRDGDVILWHFTGNYGLESLTEDFEAESYWILHQSETFDRKELKSAILWGRKEGDAWRDDRVGWARLVYPGVSSPHAQLTYWQFTHAGQVAFIWFTGLQDVEEA